MFQEHVLLEVTVSVHGLTGQLHRTDIFDHQTLCVGLISVHVSSGMLLSVLHWFVRVCKGVARSTATVLKKTLQSVQQKRATNGCANGGIDFFQTLLLTGLCSLNLTTVHTVTNSQKFACDVTPINFKEENN